MPHVIIKSFPGRTDEQKQTLSKKISEAVSTVYGLADETISIDIQEIPKENWMENVYNKDISPRENVLIKKPGYKSV